MVLRVFLIVVVEEKKGEVVINVCEYLVIYWLHTQYEKEQ
jgi:hypothetical protein